MPLELTLCTSKPDWDRLVAGSPQGSVFCRTGFLDSLGVEYDLWVVRENGHPQVGAIILRRGQDPVRAPYPFTMYQGLLFDQAFINQSVHSRIKGALDCVTFLLTEFDRRYNRISFCLHPYFEDLRGFSWFHYHEPHLGRFDIDVYYTGLIDLTKWQEFEEYLAKIRRSRRRDYHASLKVGLTVEVSRDIDALDRVHQLTFERQGVKREAESNRLLRAIAEAALTYEFGELLICRDVNREVVSAELFLYDERCGYLLIGGNDPAFRDTGSSTLMVLDSIRRCHARGLKQVDVCGINSPDRGDFKTSFNAVPVPYFVATWDRPSRNFVNAI